MTVVKAYLGGRDHNADKLLQVALLLQDGCSAQDQGLGCWGELCTGDLPATDAHHPLLACCRQSTCPGLLEWDSCCVLSKALEKPSQVLAAGASR